MPIQSGHSALVILWSSISNLRAPLAHVRLLYLHERFDQFQRERTNGDTSSEHTAQHGHTLFLAEACDWCMPGQSDGPSTAVHQIVISSADSDSSLRWKS